MSGKLDEILHAIEMALSRRDGLHAAGASVSPDSCVACRGGRQPEAMGELSAWLSTLGFDLEFFAWKINRECPRADAVLSPEGILLVRGCAVSTLVLADLFCGGWDLPDFDEGRGSHVVRL